MSWSSGTVRRARLFCAAGVLVLSCSGCAGYRDWAGLLEQRLAAGDYDGALAVLERHGRRERDRLLYQLNRALLLRMKGEYRASNAAFEEAKRLMERLEAVSVREQAGALTVNELQRSYVPEDYERTLIHVFSALNYLALDQPLEARVEVLQLDQHLRQVKSEAEAGGAFGRYFSGLLFEALGERDQALVAYRQARLAYADYPDPDALAMPRQLQRDLLRLTRALGLIEEARRLQQDFGLESDAPSDPRAGSEKEQVTPGAEVALILFSGLVPPKREVWIDAVTEDGTLVTVALPELAARPIHVQGLSLEAAGRQARGEVVEDLAVLAAEALARRRPLMLARALARAALKHEAVARARQEHAGAGLLMNVVTAATERADTRSWSLLPGQIHLVRLSLPAGWQRLRVVLLDGAGRRVQQRSWRVHLAAGELRLLAWHWIDDEDLVWPQERDAAQPVIQPAAQRRTTH